MSDRPTKEFTTPAQKAKIVIYTYLTGRESEYCQDPLYQAMSARADMKSKEGVTLGELDMGKVREMTHRLIEKMVVSVNDSSEDILNTVLDMQNEDYQHIVDTIQSISKKN